MKVVATARYIRQSPRKVRLVATAVRQLPPQEALGALQLMNAKASKAVRDVLQSAIANATNNHELAASDLRIETLEVGEGPTLKRMRAASKGRGVSVLKRTSHIRVVLTNDPVAPKKTEKNKTLKNEPKAAKTENVEAKEAKPEAKAKRQAKDKK